MKDQIVYSKEHPEFITITCLEWAHILKEDKFKNIITDSLNHLVVTKRIAIYGFVIMSNPLFRITNSEVVSLGLRPYFDGNQQALYLYNFKD